MLKITHNRLRGKKPNGRFSNRYYLQVPLYEHIDILFGGCTGSLLWHWASLKLQCKGLLSACAQYMLGAGLIALQHAGS